MTTCLLAPEVIESFDVEPEVAPVRDKYDEAIDAFYRLESQIGWKDAVALAWDVPDKHTETEDSIAAHALFQYATPDGEHRFRQDVFRGCGCLTMIRASANSCVAWTNALTNEISADIRLPRSPSRIEPHHLPIFAEWQRRLDAEIRT